MRRHSKARDYIAGAAGAATKIKNRFRPFLAAARNEGEETREAFDLLLRASRGQLRDAEGHKRRLSDEEVRKIREQALDVMRLVGITSLSILPGGTLVFILLRLFRLNHHLMPSSFKSKKEI